MRVDGSRVLLSAYSLDCLVSSVGMACNGQSEPRSPAGVVAGVLFDYLGFPSTASMPTVAPRGVRALFCREDDKRVNGFRHDAVPARPAGGNREDRTATTAVSSLYPAYYSLLTIPPLMDPQR